MWGLFPKLDELELLLQPTAADLVAISETWLREGIGDSFLQIPYNFSDVMDYAAEEEESVPLYQKLYIPSKRRDDRDNCNYECMWVWIRLPRSITGIIIWQVHVSVHLSQTSL